MKTKKVTRAARSAIGGEAIHKPILAMIKAVMIGLLATASLLLLFSFAFYRQDLPLSLQNPISSLSLVLGTFVSGHLAARAIGQRGLLIGAGCGTSLFLLLLLASLQAGGAIDLTAFFKLGISLFAGSIGGVMGVNKKSSHRIKPKRKEHEK